VDKDHSSSAEREPAGSGAVDSDDITFDFFEFFSTLPLDQDHLS